MAVAASPRRSALAMTSQGIGLDLLTQLLAPAMGPVATPV
jgi:hypothetical protein